MPCLGKNKFYFYWMWNIFYMFNFFSDTCNNFINIQFWYEIEGNEGKGLFSYRGAKGSEITTLIFLFLGLFTTILELACLIFLIFRVFGFSCEKFANKFLHFQMIFSCWTSFFWYMAIASFWILTPQRTDKHQEDEEGKKIDEIHYDLSFRTKSHLTHVGSGLNYMCIALCLTLFSIFDSAILETAVTPRNIEKNLRSNLTLKKFKSLKNVFFYIYYL